MPYTGGPGDVAGVGANGCYYGLRAFSTATIGNNLIRVTKDGGSTHQDLVSLASGYLDVATAVSYAGALPLALNVMTWYDGSANVVDVTQATDANRPVLHIPASSFPYVSFNGTNQVLAFSGATISSGTYSCSALCQTTDASGTGVWVLAGASGPTVLFIESNAGAPTTWRFLGGTTPLSYTASTGAWHSISITVDGSANGVAYVDGASAASGPVGTGGGASALRIGDFDGTFSNAWHGYASEFCYFGTTTLTSGNVTTLKAQQDAFQSAFSGSSATPFSFFRAPLTTIGVGYGLKRLLDFRRNPDLTCSRRRIITGGDDR